MLKRSLLFRIAVLAFAVLAPASVSVTFASGPRLMNASHKSFQTQTDNDLKTRIIYLTKKIDSYFTQSKISEGLALTIELRNIIENTNKLPSVDLAKPYYFIGVRYWYIENDVQTCEKYLTHSLKELDKNPDDFTRARIYRLLGIMYSIQSNYLEADKWSTKRLELTRGKTIFEYNDLVEAIIYSSLAKINIRDLESANKLLIEGFSYLNSYPDSINDWNKGFLYYSKAIYYYNLYEYNRALSNLDKGFEYESEYQPSEKLQFLSNFSASYFYVRKFEKSKEYYKKLVEMSSFDTLQYINSVSNYAIVIAETGNKVEGEKAFNEYLTKFRAKKKVLDFYLARFQLLYADYLLDYNIDYARSLDLQRDSYSYFVKDGNSPGLTKDVLLSHSLGLSKAGNPEAALDSINNLIKRYYDKSWVVEKFGIPDQEKMGNNSDVFRILTTRYLILDAYFNKTNDTKALVAAATTAGIATSMMENFKTNITDAGSRIMTGERYRNVYIDAMGFCIELYRITGNNSWLDRAFGFSERSKASGLLAMTRESKAMKLNIPDNIVKKDKELATKIGIIENLISDNERRQIPDTSTARSLNNRLLTAQAKKDSLTDYLSKVYPEYLKIKSDTSVVTMQGFSKELKRCENFVSYIITNNNLHIFLLNRRYTRLETVKIDSSFNESIIEFRRLLSEPDLRTAKAGEEFDRFQYLGHLLYLKLIEPVKDYLISDELIISPDNTLAFFPFEILLTEKTSYKEIYYRKLPYMMKDYSISYGYTATLLRELAHTKKSRENNSVSFAPTYRNISLYVDSLLAARQSVSGMLTELKHAPEEAAFVASITRGISFTDSLATENKFKSEAPLKDIIHLAMHTILDASDPKGSMMMFAKDTAGLSDGRLYPFEINSLILKAKMVVLSSCYTGSGMLFSGEGVLSLARGFISAGSNSVVMALWEVNDRSGTDIVKSFYSYLGKGQTKSKALRKARLDYLENSEQLQSHPYFWATLVVYGDDAPLYPKPMLPVFAAIGGIIILIAGLIFYLRKR
ncbi:MAG: CHAT domain-containing protein [Bacteroidales bacterium]